MNTRMLASSMLRNVPFSRFGRFGKTNARPLRTLILTARSSPSKSLPKQYRNYASTTTSSASAVSNSASAIVNIFYGATFFLGISIVVVYVTDTRASIHKWIVIPTFRTLYPDPENAHEVGNRALKSLWDLGLHPRERGDPDKSGDLEVEVFGQTLRNPIATSAGIDKHVEIPDPLFALGPAIIEIGGTTPRPQPGNEKPRVFRLTSQNALINRYGLNSEGADHVASRLRHRVRQYANSNGLGHDAQAEASVLDGETGVPPGSLTPGKLLAVNIAKNKSTPESDIDAVTKDYVYCVERLAPYADILVVNVSSPNTPGLRSLQQGESLKRILTSVVKSAHAVQRKVKPAVMVKVSPDEDSDEQVAGICEAVWQSGVDGIIVGNTTNRRPPVLPELRGWTPLEEQHMLEQGGFSGPHLFERTVALVKKYKKLLDGNPGLSEPPKRPSGAVDAAIERTKAELKASTGVTPTDAQTARDNKVAASVDRGVIPPSNISEKPDAEKQPLIRLPSNRFYDQPKKERNQVGAEPTEPESSPQNTNDQSKVIFATGGITNGKQALEVLNAGASVAMIYTALVYGGVGTVSRIKDEMRREIRQRSDSGKSA